VFWAPGMPATASNQPFRTPDVLPTILAAMGIPQTAPTDGIAFPLGG
jgi:arylsulfatase A-like enzyme